ncbi:MAG: hypothetical protein FWB85_11585 [Chitinispirillia bacterium]|nr:hypothetical protein [Chitinispirillia bacterium]MCL2242740.1 hypothetical protein [Chitinispirillia bacterium]
MKELGIERKKGDPQRLDGQVTVYAKVEADPEEVLSMKHPMASMVHGGLLAVQGNYREQSSLRDFLKNEMGISLDAGGLDGDDGLKDMIENMDGLESALDPEKLRERLDNMGDIEEFIPTPAKVVPFHSETEILDQPGDVYFAGFFKGVGNAVLAVNAIPIVYQAVFREQQMLSLQSEIESLIEQIEWNDFGDGVTIASPGVNPEEAILKEYIPSMLYQRVDPVAFETSRKQFRAFMHGYRFNDDVEAVLSLISKEKELGIEEYKLLELYAKKIAMVQMEDFAGVDVVHKEIEHLREAM